MWQTQSKDARCSGLRLNCEVERWIHNVQVLHSEGLAVKSPSAVGYGTNLVVGAGEVFQSSKSI